MTRLAKTKIYGLCCFVNHAQTLITETLNIHLLQQRSELEEKSNMIKKYIASKNSLTLHAQDPNDPRNYIHQNTPNHRATHGPRNWSQTKTEFYQVHGDRYFYPDQIIKSCETPLTIVCPVYGKFTMSAKVHLQGYGHPSSDHNPTNMFPNGLSDYRQALYDLENS